MSDKKAKWEVVSEDTARLEVSGGWLYYSESCMAFVPRPPDGWVTE